MHFSRHTLYAAGLLAGIAFAGGTAQAEGRSTPALPQATTLLPGIPLPATIAPEPDVPNGDTRSDTNDPSRTMQGRGARELQALQQVMVQELQSLVFTGDTDIDFATLMKERLEQDMKATQIETRHGRSRELRAMALRLYQAQRTAHEHLVQWLEKNGDR
ncbi:MAG: hypothetical protein K0R03_224 [Moraxellaceae bacterium]|jgi:hypothetical protein|nr:hypothetical protein [Moraxellaceae bacterium]